MDWKDKDPRWTARYHSKTPSLKRIYFNKLVNAEKYLNGKKIAVLTY
jgi:hypothetical protein